MKEPTPMYTKGTRTASAMVPPVDKDNVAIIGMAARFAGEASNCSKLWDFILSGRSAAKAFPPDRFSALSYYHPDPNHAGTTCAKAACFLDGDTTAFDAPFFTLGHNDVLAMDPQQRVLLENVYQALENSGFSMQDVAGSQTSVFVGSAFTNDFLSIANTDLDMTLKYKSTGTSPAILANRISWFYNLHGPSMTIDTACSSSLVAFHQACVNLKQGGSKMAIVSGVNLIAYPAAFLSLSSLSFLSPDGKCFSFDHRANGYGRGEGVGTMILKPLAAALRDGNTIRAVVKASGTNQDGRTPGITLPSAASQEQLIKTVYSEAELDPNKTMYVEAHGTGTQVGDPLEAKALARAFRTSERNIPLTIGSIKASIGHTEGAAGIAGLIKATMLIEHGIIPPMANFEKHNPAIPAEEWNLSFPLQATSWPTSNVRQVSVNSFGFGGSNAHVVLQSADHLRVRDHDSILESSDPDNLSDKVHSASQQSTSSILVLCAADENGVERQRLALTGFITSRAYNQQGTALESGFLSDLSYSLALSRGKLPWRAYCITDTIGSLSRDSSSIWSKPVRSGTLPPKVGFVFTGQGAQWPQMGQALLTYQPYKASIDAASTFMAALGAPWLLSDELSKDKKGSSIDDPFLAQCGTTAVQVALVDLFSAWNIRPTRVIGHSSGEIAAAYASGKLSREDAWKVAYFRGYSSRRHASQEGAMLAVAISQAEISPYIAKAQLEGSGVLVVACENSPRNITLSGDKHQIRRVRDLLVADGIFARALKVQNAYHSPHMRNTAEEYLHLIGSLLTPLSTENGGDTLMASSVSGGLMPSKQGTAAQYWVDNLLSPVKFHDALLALCFTDTDTPDQHSTRRGQARVDFLIEIGPHGALRTPIRETLESALALDRLSYFAVLDHADKSSKNMLHAAASLFCAGYPADLHAINHSSVTELGPTPSMLTDLPPYEFNHSKSFWTESRLSRNLRFQEKPRHDLFGRPVLEWNPAEPKWKNYLRRSELPWLMHHKITQNIVYPGVGYLIMALHASKELAFPDQTIAGFRFNNVTLKTALIVPDIDEGVEVTLSLRLTESTSSKTGRQPYEFHVYSFNFSGNEWIEHCLGFICVEYETSTGVVDGGRAVEYESTASNLTLNNFEAACQDPIATDVVYGMLTSVGMEFGPTFRNLAEIELGGGIGQAMGVVTVPDVASYMPKGYLQDHIIQPSTMDSMLHIFLAAIMDSRHREKNQQAMVPTFMKEVWVSAATSPTPGHKFRCHGAARPLSTTKWESQVSVWDAESREPRVMVKGMQMTPLGSATVFSANETRSLCHNVNWEYQADLLTSVDSVVDRVVSSVDESRVLDSFEKYQLASTLLIGDALKHMESTDTSLLAPHHERYLEWLLHQGSLIKQASITFDKAELRQQYETDDTLKAVLYDKIRTLGTRGELLMRMGPEIAPVMLGKSDALEMMFKQDGLMERFYDDTSLSGNLQPYLKEYLRVLGHNQTNLRILEIGAGTGSATGMVLEALQPLDPDTGLSTGSSIDSYHFTDISPGFFEQAKERFQPWAEKMQYKTLDIESSPALHGVECGSFDVVVAANVLHATADISNTLKNVRSLLKTGGKLILIESTALDHLWSCLCFGLLPGWWLSQEPYRKWGPLLNETQWIEHLRSQGFGQRTLVFQDTQDPKIRDIKGFVATATSDAESKQSSTNEVVLICGSAGQAAAPLVMSIRSILEGKARISAHVAKLEEIQTLDLTRMTCIVLYDLDGMDPLENEVEYQHLQNLVTTCKNILWVSRNHIEHPEAALMTGLLRTARWERDYDDVNFITLECEYKTHADDRLVAAILSLYDRQFADKLLAIRNGGFKLSNGQLCTNRLIDANLANEYVAHKTSTATPAAISQPYGQDNRALKLVATSPGMLNRLEFVEDELHKLSLGPDEVEISIRAASLNFLDIMVAMGEILEQNLGIEGAGFITRVGSAVGNFKPGDRVVGFKATDSGGAFRTYFRTPAAAVLAIPDSMHFEDAAAIPGIFCTVLYGLIDVARLSQGEQILIHAGAGGTGQAAIQVAQQIGAEIFVTVSTLEKRDLLKEQYGISEDHIFSSRDLSFSTSVMAMTDGRGVNVVLNSLAGDALAATWKCVAPFGRFLELGKKDALSGGMLDMEPFLKNVTYSGVNVAAMMYNVPQKACNIVQRAIEMFMRGNIKTPYPLSVYSFEGFETAFRQMQSGKMSGKIVFKPNPEDIVPVIPETAKDIEFSADETFVLSGGLGGIGRSIASWMVARGAKNLVFLARSGLASSAARTTIGELEAKVCQLKIFACDISNKADLDHVLEECRATMPPIKGCIQAAMVLQDSMFANMTHAQFNAAILPKVHGSKNLADFLPDLDFFLMLSSITGIVGNRGQANYAAGNVYQDALASSLTARGIPASSIDLGNIMSVGYVAENTGKIAVAQEWEGISQEELHSLIEYHILASKERKLSTETCQTVTGIIPSGVFAERGIPQPGFMSYPLFAQLHAVREATTVSSASSNDFPIASLLKTATSIDEATSSIVQAIKHKLSTMLSIPEDDIDQTKHLHSYGVDSLVAVEIRNWLGKEMAADIPVLDILSRNTIADLGRKIAGKSGLVNIKDEAVEV